MRSFSKNNKAVVIALFGALGLTILFSVLGRHFQMDDALIYFRYLENLTQGNGLVYNIGEQVNGLTSPFYTYLSIPSVLIFRDIQSSQMILSAAFLFFTAVMLVVTFKNVLDKKVLLFAPLLICSNYYFYVTFGLETTLFLFLILVTFYFFKKRQNFALAISVSLLFLTRGESLFLILILIGFHFLEKRKFPSWPVFIPPVLIFLVHYGFNYFYYGQMLPDTLTAKIGQGRSGLWGSSPVFLHDIKPFLSQFFDWNWLLMGTLAILASIGVYLNLKKKNSLIFILFFLAYNAFYIFFDIPYYYWYQSYNVLFLYICVMWGLNGVSAFLSKQPFSKTIQTAILGVLFLMLFIPQVSISSAKLKNIDGRREYQSVGLWLRQNTLPDATVACVEIGTIGWYSKRTIIDILGLVTPDNAKYITVKKFDEWLKHHAPDYIVVHVPLWPHEQSVQKLIDEKKYVPETGFRHEGILLLKKT